MVNRNWSTVLLPGFASASLGLAWAEPASAQNLVSQIELGVLAHDVGILGNAKESGADINGELRFVSPVPGTAVAGIGPPLRWLLTPRPNVGSDINTAGYTSQFYFGLVWTARLFNDVFRPGDGVFFDVGFGPAFNNGSITRNGNHKALGSHVLFHPSLAIGYAITPRYSVSAYYEHSSNGGLARNNAGLNNLGVRFGIGF